MKLFVACSSSDDIPDIYFKDCKELLDSLLKDHDLVFGTAHSGLMGLSHDIALKHHREITGICPEIYQEDFKKLKCSLEMTTKNIGERTNQLISSSDALLFLPGGIGTLHELFVAIDQKRCHEFDKPIIIYNSNGYFNLLLEFMDKLYQEHFSPLIDQDSYFVSDSLLEIEEYINHYKH